MSKRKVSTDALETLGTIIGENQKRDAIHLAVEPVVASEKLYPGQSITVKHGRAYADNKEPLGIVDPFLTSPVFPEQKFWFVMMPRMVHSLRHVWTHPAFTDEPEVAASTNLKADYPPIKTLEQCALEKKKDVAIRYIESVADEADLSVDELLEGAHQYLEYGEYLNEGSRWESFYLDDEFWIHYEVHTGIEVPEEKRGSFFSCSC